jgi:hypothetical protein
MTVICRSLEGRQTAQYWSEAAEKLIAPLERLMVALRGRPKTHRHVERFLRIPATAEKVQSSLLNGQRLSMSTKAGDVIIVRGRSRQTMPSPWIYLLSASASANVRDNSTKGRLSTPERRCIGGPE